MRFLNTRSSAPGRDRRSLRSAPFASLLVSAAMTWSCGGSVTPDTQTPQTAGETSESSKTILKSGGCSIQVEKRDWRQVEKDEAGTATWETTDEGPGNWLTVFPMEINMKTPPEEWKLDVEATLNLRRYADREQHGPQVELSESEFVEHPQYPGGFYTQIDAKTGEGMITLTRMSPKLECAVFLVGELGTHKAMAERAHELLRAVAFEQE